MPLFLEPLSCMLAAGTLSVVVEHGPEPRLLAISPDNTFVLDSATTLTATDGATGEQWTLLVPEEWRGELLPETINRCVQRAAADSLRQG